MKPKSIINDDMLTVNNTKLLLDFNAALENLMATDEVHDMSEEEVQVLGTMLTLIVEETISKRLGNKKEEANQYSAMSDEEFQDHLTDRYGFNWALMTLTPEEMSRFPKLDLDKIREKMKTIGEALRKYLDCNGVRLK